MKRRNIIIGVVVLVILALLVPTEEDEPEVAAGTEEASNEEPEEEPQGEPEDVEIKRESIDYIVDVIEYPEEETNSILLTVIISEDFDWDNKRFTEQGRCAQDIITGYKNSDAVEGYGLILIHGNTEEGGMAFTWGNDLPGDIQIWEGSELKNTYSWE